MSQTKRRNIIISYEWISMCGYIGQKISQPAKLQHKEKEKARCAGTAKLKKEELLLPFLEEINSIYPNIFFKL